MKVEDYFCRNGCKGQYANSRTSEFRDIQKAYLGAEFRSMVSPYPENRSPSQEGQCTMRSPGHYSRRKHRSTDDSSSNISQPSQKGDRSIGELIVERGHWSNNPFQLLISDFRARSACSGFHNRINVQSNLAMVCDGKTWKGFRRVDGGKLVFLGC